MRVIADRVTDRILQSSLLTDPLVVNGQYCLELPASVSLTDTSYILNGGVEDAGSIITATMANHLSLNTGFTYEFHNFFLTQTDVAKVYLAGGPCTIGGDVYANPRVLTGDTQGAANCVGILPVNATVTPNLKGVMWNRAVDLTLAPYLLGAQSRFKVWWDLATMSVSADVYTAYPAPLYSTVEKTLTNLSHTSTDVTVYLSANNGVDWTAVGWMEEVVLAPAISGTDIILAFVNNSSGKVYCNGYAVIF